MTQRQVQAVKSAIHDGFGGRCRIEEVEPPVTCSPDSRAYEIHVEGLDGPITLNMSGIDVPDNIPAELVAGIRLDCQAVMATTK